MRHLTGIAGLTKSDLEKILETAHNFIEVSEREIKKVPTLRGKTIVNLFLEPSTRTRTSFEIAGKRLSADTINISAGDSSTKKGETLLDTARTIEAMAPDVLVVRHKESGAPDFLAKRLKGCAVVNAGDGMHEHPTQALLDLLTLQEHLHSGQPKALSGLKIAIVGDVRHSRVARSNVLGHQLLGNEVRLVGPRTLVPESLKDPDCFGEKVKIFWDLRDGIKGVDIVMVLRMQVERQGRFFIPSTEEYSREYGVTENILKECAPSAVILHPGPMNRGVEITSEVADGPRSLVPKQVRLGVALRMAVLFLLATREKEEPTGEISR